MVPVPALPSIYHLVFCLLPNTFPLSPPSQNLLSSSPPRHLALKGRITGFKRRKRGESVCERQKQQILFYFLLSFETAKKKSRPLATLRPRSRVPAGRSVFVSLAFPIKRKRRRLAKSLALGGNFERSTNTTTPKCLLTTTSLLRQVKEDLIYPNHVTPPPIHRIHKFFFSVSAARVNVSREASLSSSPTLSIALFSLIHHPSIESRSHHLSPWLATVFRPVTRLVPPTHNMARTGPAI
jgi:hypothetical protein